MDNRLYSFSDLIVSGEVTDVSFPLIMPVVFGDGPCAMRAMPDVWKRYFRTGGINRNVRQNHSSSWEILGVNDRAWLSLHEPFLREKRLGKGKENDK